MEETWTYLRNAEKYHKRGTGIWVGNEIIWGLVFFSNSSCLYVTMVHHAYLFVTFVTLFPPKSLGLQFLSSWELCTLVAFFHSTLFSQSWCGSDSACVRLTTERFFFNTLSWVAQWTWVTFKLIRLNFTDFNNNVITKSQSPTRAQGQESKSK